MFSPIRMVPCSVRWSETREGVRTPLDPRAEIADAWLELMQRARRAAIDGYAAHRCAILAERDTQPGLYLDLRCEHPDGMERAGTDPDVNLCEAR